ncbi:hypothetical protein C5O19_22100 [Siphonobacter curvatus]|uniref:Uncharacterized protein n=2 Tax=Siphonobacter curvatus TaxID=2094562 RepID=A0A2S7IG16_9BACT|nr:hypothetical protein C5O19_22100 [Siphonobacter curvatus]
MIIPNSRKEFEKHLNLLAESARTKKLKMPLIPRLINGLSNAKFSPNRRINLSTIDETTRLLANTLNTFDKDKFNNNE